MTGPQRSGGVVEACGALLLASMALYGVVQIVQAIWIPLCIMALVAAALCVAYLRFRRW